MVRSTYSYPFTRMIYSLPYHIRRLVHIDPIVYWKNWWNGSLRNKKNYPFFFDQFFILLLSIYYLLVSRHDKRNYDADKRKFEVSSSSQIRFISFYWLCRKSSHTKTDNFEIFYLNRSIFLVFFGLQQRIRYKISCINCYTPVTA